MYICIYTWCILYIHLISYRHKSNIPFLLLKSSMKSQHASTWMGSTSQVTLRESLLGWTKTVRPDDGREVMGTAFCRGNAAQNDPNFQIGGRKLHIRYVRYVSWLKDGKSWVAFIHFVHGCKKFISWHVGSLRHMDGHTIEIGWWTQQGEIISGRWM